MELHEQVAKPCQTERSKWHLLLRSTQGGFLFYKALQEPAVGPTPCEARDREKMVEIPSSISRANGTV